MSEASRAVEMRITDYLCSGGLFNPELANHDAVRDLLIDARDALTAERERADRLQIAVDGAAGLLTYAAYGADRCCNRPCSEVEEMVRRSTQMRAWVLKYGKWKMGIAHPETEAEISISIDAARRK